MRRLISVLVLLLVGSLALAGTAWAAPKGAIQQIDWESERVDHVGKTLHLSVFFSGPSAASCTAILTGPTNKRLGPIRMSGTALYVPTKGLKAGKYEVILKCAQGAPKSAGLMILVPVGKPLKPVCQVREQGFSYDGEGNATAGIVFTNASPYVGLSAASLIFNFRDAAGNLIHTETTGIAGVGPGVSRPVGIDNIDIDSTPTSMEVIPSCTGPGAVEWFDYLPLTTISSEEGYSYIRVVGTVTNTYDKALESDYTFVRFVTRDQTGRITGGSRVSIADVDVPPGVEVRFSTSVFGLTSLPQATQVEAVFTPVLVGDS